MTSRIAVTLLLFLLTACSRSVSQDDDAGTDAAADGTIPFVPVGADTVVPAMAAAGDEVQAHCLLLDENGESHVPTAEQYYYLRVDPEASVTFDMEDPTKITPRVAGAISVTCVFPGLGLTDVTPSLITITPGAPAFVEAHLDRDSIVAGESVVATCTALDAHGNVVADVSPGLRVDPEAAGNTVDAMSATFERAGMYDVSCDLAGAESRSVRLEVVPALPASLVIALSPNEPVYEVGQVITLERIVEDRYGNRIDNVPAPVTHNAAMGQTIGDGRVRFLADGTYTLTATVGLPTESGVPLTASVMVNVDSSGPVIGCGSPANAAILNQTPSGNVTFNGTVSDASGVASVRVNGVGVALAGDGSFSRSIPIGFGINFVDVSATDTNGVETTRVCSFLVADTWAHPTNITNDMVSLKLNQAAVDDNNRNPPINSMSDLLNAVLNSQGLRDTLHTALSNANPLKPSACDSQTCTFLGCVCWLRSEVRYVQSQLNGPNTAQLTLVNNGLGAVVSMSNVRVRLRIRGTVVGINYDTEGWATISNVTVRLTFDTAINAGRPRVTVRPGSVMTTVGSISTDFSGIDGALINIGVSIANGTVRDLVSNLLTSYVRDNFNSVLDGVLGNLDIDSLGASFNVPRLDGAGSVALSFGINFSTLTSSTSRMLFGLGTRISAPAAHARPTLGTPMEPGAALLDPSTGQPAAVAVHVAVLGQALHALWRAGFFDVTLDSGDVPGLPAGVTAQLTPLLPPAVRIVSGRLQLSIGAAQLRLTYPALFAQPIDLALGVRASMAISLVGNDLNFTDFQISELRFSTTSVNLDAATRDQVQSVLTRILGRVVGSALNSALPAIPIPSFELPASLSQFGLPAGASVGITSPGLTNGGRHFTLTGGFGIR